jgi:hypothetical protein
MKHRYFQPRRIVQIPLRKPPRLEGKQQNRGIKKIKKKSH